MIPRSVLLSLIVCTIGVYTATRLLATPNGLEGTYYDGPDWSGQTTSFVDDTFSTRVLRARRDDRGERPFSVEWHGFIMVPFGGTYAFRTVSHDGSSVYVQGRDVVANAGSPGIVDARGSVTLQAGVHSIFVRYSHRTDDCVFELSWSRDGRTFGPVPAWALLTHRVSYRRAIALRTATIAFALLAIAWYLFIAWFVLKWTLAAASRVFRFRPEGLGPALRMLVAVSALMNAWGIWWAMPNTRGWAPDEVVPADVLNALGSSFSHGWHEKYPPFHYFVLAAAESPIVLMSWLGIVDVNATTPYVMLVVIGRLVSLVFAAGTVVIVYRCGLQLYGHRGALFAAATAALTVPFAYYGKLANLDVPYLFWFTVSLFAYIRILQRHDRRDYLLFAASAVLAGCTKDQIWGAYFVTPFAILVARAMRAKESGRSIRDTLVDRTVLQAVLVGVATFVVADNLVFDFNGFVAHVRLLLGTPAPFQEFPRTVAGQLRMAGHAVIELRYMFGWPLAILTLGAFLSASMRRTTTPSLHWLLVPALSYYAAFIGVILFYFDRYLFPISIVLAVYVGWWLDRFLAPHVRARTARVAVVTAAFAYSTLYVAAVNYAMTVDSRYALSRWLHAHAHPNDVVGSLGPLEYHAIADSFTWESIESIDDVARVRPGYVVLNRDEMPFLPATVQAMHDALRDGRAGYRLAQTFRSRMPPLPGLHPDLGADIRHGPEFSDLAMINPTMEVFVRKEVDR